MAQMNPKELELLEESERIHSKCKDCELWTGRLMPVFARGNKFSRVMICGMCPGPDENKAGKPFVGTAGKILDAIILDAGLSKYEPYITNLVKCFVKPGTPLKEEWMNSCSPYFNIQVAVIKPKIIVALGKDVCNYLLDNSMEMGGLRGKIYDSYFEVPTICTYHPSYLARGGGQKHSHYKTVVEDFSQAHQFV